MQLPVNTLKQKLTAGEVQYGLWSGLVDSSCAEINAGSGFDWLLIDAEHAPFELGSIKQYLQTVAAYDTQAVVRPVSDDRNLIKQILDLGAQSLLIPMVETVAQAERIVESVYYPPEGERGLGTALARAARWNRIPGYAHKANKEICLMLQIETTTGIENLTDIAAIAGIHGIFIGPSDLSASMGFVGNASHAQVVSTITQALQDISSAGKFAGLLCLDKSMVADYVVAGARFVGVAVDTLLLANSTSAAAQEFIQADKNKPKDQASDQASY